MREILFRGKSVNNGEWVYGSLVITTLEPVDDAPIKHYHIEDMTIGCFPNEFQSGLSETIDPNTVGQFTGLYNAANQKIWEGDIVRFGNANFVVQREDETPGGYWASTAYIMKEIGVCDYMSFVDTIDDYYNEICVEIIGNIHDNPELLEVE